VALILDTGPTYALLDRSDAAHEACRALIEGATEPLVLPGPTLSEVDYWVSRRRGPAAMGALLDDVSAGAYQVEDLADRDYPRVAELLRAYQDLELGFVDAAVVAIAERLGEPKLATLDRRHFSVVRPRHVEVFRLLPG
jgi:uncharacterized protein